MRLCEATRRMPSKLWWYNTSQSKGSIDDIIIPTVDDDENTRRTTISDKNEIYFFLGKCNTKKLSMSKYIPLLLVTLPTQ